MTAAVQLGITGASGRMGQALTQLLRGDRRFALVRAVTRPGSELIGQPVRLPQTPDVPLYSDSWDGAAALDVIVDFSSPQGLAKTLDHCLAHQVALVVGTTGMDAALEQRLREAGTSIPILVAANFSLGVAVLGRLLREAAALLPDWDLEIVEAHHGRKQDAPSGTALALGRAAAQARGVDLDAVAARGRDGHTGARASGEIGFAVVRAGDIVGEHTALLATAGERVELSHRATDRSIFARGALQAAGWLARQRPGSYRIEDMLENA